MNSLDSTHISESLKNREPTIELIHDRKPRLNPDCILIDDDELVQFSWRLSAKSACRPFVGFSKPDDFFLKASEFDLGTPIYVDCHLGNGISGEEVAKKLFELGFKNIFISTGYTGRTFPNLPFLKGVVGKDPIWVTL